MAKKLTKKLLSELYGKGLSLEECAEYLDHAGIRTVRGKIFSAANVSRMGAEYGLRKKNRVNRPRSEKVKTEPKKSTVKHELVKAIIALPVDSDTKILLIESTI